jgi:hypothetical protein
MDTKEALDRVETLRRNSIDRRSEAALSIVLAMANAAKEMERALRAMVLARGCVGCLVDGPPYVPGKDCRVSADEHRAQCASTPALAALASWREAIT